MKRGRASLLCPDLVDGVACFDQKPRRIWLPPMAMREPPLLPPLLPPKLTLAGCELPWLNLLPCDGLLLSFITGALFSCGRVVTSVARLTGMLVFTSTLVS